MDEQIEIMRRLWREELVTFQGKWHTISDAGIEPRPASGTVPLWFGGSADPVLRRMARHGDGWMNNQSKPEDAKPLLETLQIYLAEVGRSWDDFGLEPRVNIRGTDPDGRAALVSEWQSLGATHLSYNTMYGGFTTSAQHIEAIRQFAELVGVKPE
jgi:alkanesulfonate monooxygenase SsuD/methylene tetrahydromethanopterin reductase-like flavin-dependent oxidoreductase (luciferase family)